MNGIGNDFERDVQYTAPSEGKGRRVLLALGASAGWLALYFGLRFTLSTVLVMAYYFMGFLKFGYDMTQIINWVAVEKIAEVSFLEIIFSTVSFFAAVWIVGLIRDRRKPAELRVGFFRDTGFVRFSPALIPILLIMGFSLNMFVSLLFEVLPIPAELLEDYANQSSLLGEFSVLSVLSTAIFAPLSEELIFRGLLISRMRRGVPLWLAVLIPSLIFGLIHGQILWICYAFMLGLLLSLICLRAHSTAASALLHMAFNASSFVLPFIPIPEDSPKSTIYTLFAVSGVVSIAMIAVMLLLTRKKESNNDAQKEAAV